MVLNVRNHSSSGCEVLDAVSHKYFSKRTYTRNRKYFSKIFMFLCIVEDNATTNVCIRVSSETSESHFHKEQFIMSFIVVLHIPSYYVKARSKDG